MNTKDTVGELIFNFKLEVLCMLATQVLVCLPIGWVEVLEVLRMLDAQGLVYLSIGLKCWKFCACWPHRYLCACLSVGSCVGQVVFTLVCKYFLPFGDVGCTGTSVPISWVEVLEVLRMLDAKVLVCQLVGLKCWKFCGCWMQRY